MQQQTSTPPSGGVTYAACPNCLKVNKISIARAQTARPTCGACRTEIEVHGAVVNVTTRSLQKLIQSSPLPVIVDFWAPWCAPCRAFAPTFERVAAESAGTAVFVKIDTQAQADASPAYGVRGIPTLAVFRGGQETQRESGAMPYEYFRPWVQQVVRG